MSRNRTEFIAFRVSKMEKDKLKALANQNGFTLSTLARMVMKKLI
jgi:antitoxin component of RelBE/YafQ-DinJ toxin-antitoxin module